MKSEKVKEIKKGAMWGDVLNKIGYYKKRFKYTKEINVLIRLINDLEAENKQALKDCLASNKITEEIGYKNGKKDTATEILTYLKNRQLVGEYELNKLAEKYGVEL